MTSLDGSTPMTSTILAHCPRCCGSSELTRTWTCCTATCALIDEKGDKIRTCRARRWNASRLRRRCFLHQPAVFFRRAVLQRCGPLDQKLKYWMDYEYWLRLSDASVRFERIPRILAGSRIHQDMGQSGVKARNEEYAATEEVVRMLADRDGQLHTLWILRHARAMAARDGQIGQNTCGRGQGISSPTLCDRSDMWNQDRRSPMVLVRLATRIVLDEFAERFKRRRRAEQVAKRKDLCPASSRAACPVLACLVPAISAHGGHAAGLLGDAQLQRCGVPRGDNSECRGANLPEPAIRCSRWRFHRWKRRYHSTARSFLAHWESGPDRGQAHAINAGLRHATGEMMAYLNSDDLMLPGAVGYAADYLSRHPEVDVVYGHRILINGRGDEIGRWVLPPHDDRALAWADYIPQETMFWRRRAWEIVGGQIDESFQFAMDWDLILRFRDAGLRFARVPRFLGAFRVTEAQKTASLIQTVGKREMDRLRLRVLGRVPTPQEIHEVLKPFYFRQRVYDRLYRLGVAKY